ncbi:hypothetical protein [Lysinibacillus fusiformis]|uniref:hypothetical protein n=1 Tax=Lysinibacillus fusiformis TaxID=28031 RepID=UPI00215A954B|nr:hypothetical protein [Lysinibacillus fusiformis]MCR8852856.1 hypothetical protein [Lysinibacillus fusiformis]
MISNEKDLLENEIINLLSSKNSRPYIFRTRLERVLERLLNYSEKNNLTLLRNKSLEVKSKLSYISDQSNQTSDGSLKSFVFLESDIKQLPNYLER